PKPIYFFSATFASPRVAEEKGIPTDPLDIEKGRERNLEEIHLGKIFQKRSLSRPSSTKKRGSKTLY
ncbi:hypothetical protein, partial [Porphyromonas endodontalis]|uniref:hypothetical protein n=1 Tax=Porphyromonas endodontalis TaxID=28124 RepID=UPI0026EE23E4